MWPSLVSPWKLPRPSLDRADRPAGAVITLLGWNARSTAQISGTTKTMTARTAASTYRMRLVVLSGRPARPPGAGLPGAGLRARARAAGRSTVVAIAAPPD